MAIQVRRGNESSFQPNKMVAGEPAVTLDSKKIYYAFAPSDVKEIATTDIVTDAVANAKTEIMTDIANETSFAENQRILAESIRSTNEITRVQNESVRVSNEQRRLNDVYVATTNCNLATNDAIDIKEQIENETLIIWKNNVATYSAIASTYPTPQNGWTTVASDTGIRWRYNGSSWVSIGVESTNQAGDLSQLKTQNKSSLVGAINDSIEYANDGNSDEVSGVHYIQSNLSVDGNTELVEVLGNTIVGDGVTLPTPETPQPLKSLGYKKNLFDNKQAVYSGSNATVTILPTGIKIKSNSSGTWNRITYLVQLKPNTTYNLSYVAKVITGYFVVSVRKEDNTSSYIEYIGTFTTNSNALTYFNFYCTNGTAAVGEVDLLNLQLEEGSIATSYVPYGECDFTVMSNGKNLFDNKNYTNAVLNRGVTRGTMINITESGFTLVSTSADCHTDMIVTSGKLATNQQTSAIKIKGGTAYKLSVTFAFSTSTSGMTYWNFLDEDFNYISITSRVSGSGTTIFSLDAPTNAVYCTIRFGITVSGVRCVLSNIQLEEGSTGTTYSPYNNGYFWYDNNDRNLFDIRRELFSNSYSTVSQLKNGIKVKGTISGSWLNVAYNYDLKPNTTYNIKFTPSVISGAYRTSIKKAIDNATIIETTLTSYSFTTDATGGTILSFYCTGGTSVIGEVDYTNIQLEEQKTSTLVSSYNPYYKTVPYTLRALSDGTKDRIYTENGRTYLEQNIDEVVLNGSESWSSPVVLTDTVRFICMSYNCSKTNWNIQSSRFISSNVLGDVEHMGNSVGNGLFAIWVNKSRLTTQDVAGLQAWLSLNPTTVQYKRVAPIVTEISRTELPSFDGQTNVSVISTVLPTSVKASFRSSVYSVLQNKIKYLEELIADLYSKLP